MLLSQIAEVCGGSLLGDDRRVSVAASVDSRAIQSGGLYCALPGERADGHDYVDAAFQAGAAAAIVSREVTVRPIVVVDDVQQAMGKLAAAHVASLRSSGGLTVLAVTGSAGKTTTKDLLAAALPGPTVATERSFNNEIGLPLTALRATASTRYLVLEMGADKEGDLRYLTGLVPPDVAIVLMVGRAHLGIFGSQDAIRRAKQELVEGLAPSGVAVLNDDDAQVLAMASAAPGRVLRFGQDPRADVVARNISLDASSRAAFDVTSGAESAHVQLGIVGEHHVSNALAALAGARAAGVPLVEAAARINEIAPASPHRMAVSERGGVVVIDDSYNANPDSMAAGLSALARLAAGRSIAVLGEMRELGEAAPAEHAAVGRRAQELGIDHVIVVGPGAAAIAEGYPAARLTGSLDAAREALSGLVQVGDTVLFKASNGTGLWRLAEEWTP